MDINSRINWMPGMEVTAETFLGMAENWNYKYRLSLRAALGNNRMGLLPESVFNCNGIFVKNRFEVDHLQCLALLASGRIVSADEDVQVTIPMLFGERYYLTVGFGEELTEYEMDGVPYVRPHYVYGISTMEDIEANDLFPLLRFKVTDGVFSMDTEFIPPCLLLSADLRFLDYIERYVDKLSILASHKSLADGEGKRTLLRYVFRLKGYNLQNSMQDFVLLTQEIAQAIDYYIVTPNREQPTDVPQPSYTDIQIWLQWLDDYLAGAAVILDGVVLEDNTIDYEALLAQAKAELYSQLHPELIAKLLADMKEELRAEMQQQTESLTNYINNNLKAAIMEQLGSEMDNRMTQLSVSLNQKFDQLGKDLSESLYEKLYFNMFDHLFNALYVPEPEEKEYIPLI